MPLVIPATYLLVLPRPDAFAGLQIPSADEDEALNGAPSEYAPLPTDDNDAPEVMKSPVALSASDKWYLVKPLLLKYMLPLCKLYPESLHIGFLTIRYSLRIHRMCI
jgi:battenin